MKRGGARVCVAAWLQYWCLIGFIHSREDLENDSKYKKNSRRRRREGARANGETNSFEINIVIIEQFAMFGYRMLHQNKVTEV